MSRDRRQPDAPTQHGDAAAPPDEVVEVPITDELDLHTFHPREVKDLVAHYLDEAADRGFPLVRIIHGKGTGTLRRIVHSVLDRHPAVASYRAGQMHEGAWGATVVTLHQKS